VRNAQDTNNSLTLRGPRQMLRGGTNYTFGLARITANVTNNVITLPTAVSNVTLFTAMAGAYLPEFGAERNILGIHSAGGWPWASHVRLYQSGGVMLVAQTYGQSGQAFWSPTPTVFPFDVKPRTYALAVDGGVNSVLLVVDGWVAALGNYAHGDPIGMTVIDFGAGVVAPDNHLKGNYALQAVWNRALNTNEIKALDAIVRRTVLPENRIVFEGDSITDIQVDGRSFWQDLFGYGSDWSLSGNPVSIATGGHSTSNITNEWPAQVLPFAPAGNIERSIVVLWVGANDVGNYPAASRSNAEIFANLRTLWRQAKTLGFEVCAVTLFRRTSNQRATCEADVSALNVAIRADLGINYDYLVDVEAAMTASAGEGYWNNPAYFPDGVHPNTTASRAVIVEVFKSVGRKIFP
jgi:lysophospholipase L1-like esterase